MRARRDERGLVALDWMLIFAGVVGAAVGTTVVLQNFFEESAYEGADPIVRVIEADIAAARIAAEAQRLFERDREKCLGDPDPPAYLCKPIDVPMDKYGFDGYHKQAASDFKSRCEDLYTDFDDVLDSAAVWTDPKDPDGNDGDGDMVADDKVDTDGNPVSDGQPDDPDQDDHRPARCVLTPKPLG